MLCHVRHTATIQAKRDAATSTLREKRFRRVSGCIILHMDVSHTDSDYVYVYDEWV